MASRFEWVLPSIPPPALESYPAAVARILGARGLATESQAEQFFARTSNSPADPFLLQDMERAVERLAQALHDEELVVVYGDYDADGLTATSLLMRYLGSLGFRVRHYIPNRFDEGYGLNAAAVEEVAKWGAGLLVTVDCGVRAVEQVELARGLGMDVIITDHHHLGPALPEALAVIDPKRPGDSYPIDFLSGVGLAFKLAQGLSARLDVPDPAQFLDLVALGTIADIAPLQGENRRLVAEGLSRINETPRVGLAALIDASGLRQGGIDATAVAFGLAPRLNAAGRLETAESAFRLLMTDDPGEAAEGAAALNRANQQRQQLTRKMVELARGPGLRTGPEAPLIISIHPDFNEGIVGLAAARLADEFYRPAIVARQDGDQVRGSARSIPGFHITEALTSCQDLLTRFGGHAAAAGFVARTEDLDRLIERLLAYAKARRTSMPERPRLHIDAVVERAELDDGLLDYLDAFEPCGEGNARPVFLLRQALVTEKRAVGRDRRHIKLMLASGGRYLAGIAFRQGDRAEECSGRVDVVFHFERNEYMGVVTQQANVLDFSPSG